MRVSARTQLNREVFCTLTETARGLEDAEATTNL